MDPLGAMTLTIAATGGLWMALRPASGVAPLVAVGALWASMVCLVARFVTVDLRLESVAGFTSDATSWPLRIAGTWAGPAGSLLLWITLVGSALMVAAKSAAGRRVAGAAVAAGAVVTLLLANPFAHVTDMTLAGAGLNPVLEHWAMVIHPPLLYSAQAAVLGAAVATVGVGRQPAARAWLATATALLVCATMLGAWWAHDELGWGGWWAWDVVENTALAPLLVTLAALHSWQRRVSVLWCRIGAAAVLAGIAVTRSGMPRSVHAFSAGGRVALVFLAAAVTVVASLIPLRHVTDTARSPGGGASPHGPWRYRWATRSTGIAAAWGLVVIGSGAVASLWLGHHTPPAAVDGVLLGRLMAPAGAVLVIGMAATLAATMITGPRCRGSGRRGGRSLGGRNRPATAAHLGALVLALGAMGSLFDSSTNIAIDAGRRADVDGMTIEVRSIMVDEPNNYTQRATIELTLDGTPLQPKVLRYLDLGRTRARPARIVGPLGETEVVVGAIDGDTVYMEIRRQPLLPLVWAGSLMVVLSLAAAAASSFLRTPGSPDGLVDGTDATPAGSADITTGPPDPVEATTPTTNIIRPT